MKKLIEDALRDTGLDYFYIKRARNVAAPTKCIRLNKNTPCTKTGSCMDCQSPDTICCQFLITRYSRHADRIHVILVNSQIGF